MFQQLAETLFNAKQHDFKQRIKYMKINHANMISDMKERTLCWGFMVYIF